MANFGWAYVNCADTGSGNTSTGPTGSVQFLTGSGNTSGSYWLSASYNAPNAYRLALSGILNISAEQGADPSQPSNGAGGYLYTKADGGLYWRSYEGIFDLTMDTGSSGGPSGSVQFKKGTTNTFTGSSAFVFELSNKVLSSSCGIQYSYTGSVGQTGPAAYTASLSNYLIGIHSQTAAVTIKLPSATAAGYGHTYVIKDESGQASSKNITITASGSNTIDGQNSVTLGTDYISISLYCNGKTAWHIH